MKMKKIVIFMVFLFVSAIDTNAKTKILNAADFGIVPGGEDCVPGLLKALEACKTDKGSTLVFPQGTYHFYPDFGVDKYCFISNNDEGLKRVMFPLEGVHDLTIDGGGSLFVFHGFVNPFVVDHSQNVIFRNFTIDCARPFHSEAIIIANHSMGVDIEIPENFPYRLVHHSLLFTDGGALQERGTPDARTPFFLYDALLEFDSKKREPAYGAHDYYLDNIPLTAMDLGGRRVRLFLEGLKGTVGNVLTFNSENRNYPGFVLTDSRDITFDRVTIHHSGGMGIIGQRVHNVSVLNCKVTPSEGRIVSCTADATHFVNCTGKIEIADCLFENQKDDATNIHGIYMKISRQMSPTELIVQNKHIAQYGFELGNGPHRN